MSKSLILQVNQQPVRTEGWSAQIYDSGTTIVSFIIAGDEDQETHRALLALPYTDFQKRVGDIEGNGDCDFTACQAVRPATRTGTGIESPQPRS
ncbi:MAG: hypothetical protein SFW62_02520 [Alphaproteobacteria bacterium]|nr:hypothetical protein [Alphaproteobacteria bacterium]